MLLLLFVCCQSDNRSERDLIKEISKSNGPACVGIDARKEKESACGMMILYFGSKSPSDT